MLRQAEALEARSDLLPSLFDDSPGPDLGLPRRAGFEWSPRHRATGTPLSTGAASVAEAYSSAELGEGCLEKSEGTTPCAGEIFIQLAQIGQSGAPTAVATQLSVPSSDHFCRIVACRKRFMAIGAPYRLRRRASYSGVSAHRWRLGRGAAPGSSTATECPVHRNFSHCISFVWPDLLGVRSRCVYDTHNSLTAGVDIDVARPDLLLTFAAVPLRASICSVKVRSSLTARLPLLSCLMERLCAFKPPQSANRSKMRRYICVASMPSVRRALRYRLRRPMHY